MIMLADHSVTTTGINWESVGALAAIFGIMLSLITLYFARRDIRQQRHAVRQEKQNEEIKDQIATSINTLSEVLQAKLETKEVVNQISVRLARVEGRMKIDSDPGVS
jgi:hypothetical protein